MSAVIFLFCFGILERQEARLSLLSSKSDNNNKLWLTFGFSYLFFSHYENYVYKFNVWFTPARTPFISGLKSRVLKLQFFNLKMMMKNGLDFFFEIHRAPSEIPANLPGQFSLSGQIFLHWAAVTLKGLGEFQNKKF